MNGSIFIGVLIAAAGAIGLPITVFLIFFEVKPAQKIQLSRREMLSALMFLALLILGATNLYALRDTGDENPGEQDKARAGDVQGPDSPDGETPPGQEGGGTAADPPEAALSPEELLVKQNWDLIQRLKAEYSDADPEIMKSESGSVSFYIYEKAGYACQDLMNAGQPDLLAGESISSAKLVMMDDSSDAIICVLSSGEYGEVRCSPGSQNEFYGVIFHDDFEIQVTPPIQVVDGDYDSSIPIYLEKRGSQYTPLFQLRLHMRDLSRDEPYSIVPSEYFVDFTFEKKHGTTAGGISYQSMPTEAGLLPWGNNTYFSLNTSYEMDISLRTGSHPDWVKSTHRTFDGSVTSSNQIDLYFEFNTNLQ